MTSLRLVLRDSGSPASRPQIGTSHTTSLSASVASAGAPLLLPPGVAEARGCCPRRRGGEVSSEPRTGRRAGAARPTLPRAPRAPAPRSGCAHPPEGWRAPQSLNAHEPLPGGGRRPGPNYRKILGGLKTGTRRDGRQPLRRPHSLPAGIDDPTTQRSSPARIIVPAETWRRLRLGRGQGQETKKCGTAAGAQLVCHRPPAGPRVLPRNGPPAGAQA